MKRILALLLLSACILSVYSQGQFKKYPVKSGIVEYKWEGSTSGTETLYFDDYGYKEAKYNKTSTSMMGMTIESNTLEIFDGSTVYSVNLDENTASKTNMAELEELGDNADYEDYSSLTIESLGYVMKGQETICGKTCDVYEGMGKIWMWKGLVLKSSTKVLGIEATITATSIKTDVSIPSSKFELPEGVELTIEIDEILIEE